MLTFLALYRGDSTNDARLIAVSSDHALVAEFAQRLIHHHPTPGDPVVREVEQGRRRALRLIAREGEAVAR